MTRFIIGIITGSIVIFVCFVFLFYFFLKRRSLKKTIKKIGQKAEAKINFDIKLWAKHTKNKFIPATLFKYDQNKVFEVDSILISNKALFVIEIKSIRGGIKGDAFSPTWTKVLGEKKFPTTNPIIQNDKHIKHIVKMTHIKIPTISLIIYANRTEYIDVKNIPSYATVVRHVNLFEKLDKMDATLPYKISNNEKKGIFNSIMTFKTKKLSDKKLHKQITERKIK